MHAFCRDFGCYKACANNAAKGFTAVLGPRCSRTNQAARLGDPCIVIYDALRMHTVGLFSTAEDKLFPRADILTTE